MGGITWRCRERRERRERLLNFAEAVGGAPELDGWQEKISLKFSALE